MANHVTARNESVSLIGPCGPESRRNLRRLRGRKRATPGRSPLQSDELPVASDLRLSTSLQSQAQTWNGVTKSISLGGLSIDFFLRLPATLNQHILLSLSPGRRRGSTVGVHMRYSPIRGCARFRLRTQGDIGCSVGTPESGR